MSPTATGCVTFEDYFESEVAEGRDPDAPRNEWVGGVVYSLSRDDRDGKFQAYERIDSLDEYVLVSQHVRKVEVFRRSTGFRGDVAVGGESFVVHGVSIAVDDIYGGPLDSETKRRRATWKASGIAQLRTASWSAPSSSGYEYEKPSDSSFFGTAF